MKKPHKTPLVLFLVIAQSVFAIAVGIAALFVDSLSTVPSCVEIDGIPVGGMDYNSAYDMLVEAYTEKLENSSLMLQIEDGPVYEVPFSQIDAQISTDDAINKVIRGSGSIIELPAFLNSYFGHSKHIINPVISFNESKLRSALIDIANEIRIDPINAKIGYNNGTIIKSAETDGLELDVANTVDVIKQQLSKSPWSVAKLTKAQNYELKKILPDIGLRDYEDIQVVLAEYKTPIIDKELRNGISIAVDSINGIILEPYSKSPEKSAFSFVERLSSNNTTFNNDDDGYDQVASTLYAAILSSGLPDPAHNITRIAHDLAVDYIEPGLDARISGNGGDLKLTNSFGGKIAIFAEINDDNVKVVIAGSLADMKNSKITTEVTEKIAPTVYYVENSNLKPGEKVVLSRGREGAIVNVYRDDELITTDRYEAEKSIVQVGPNTSWNSDDGK